MITLKTSAIALGVAGALAFAAVPASAGPMMPNQAAVKAAAPDITTGVQWRERGYRRGIGPGIAFGLAAGALAGAAIASQPYGYRYYEEPVYAAPYGYQPMYEAPVAAYGYPPPTYGYAPGYRYRGQCSTDEGYGRRSAC